MIPGTFRRQLFFLLAVLYPVIFAAGCSNEPAALSPGEPAGTLTLPQLNALNLDGEPLKVVATTSIIGDVVTRIGGDAITVTTLMAPGQDPHSYEPRAQELANVAEADVIFVNGWNLEEALVGDVQETGTNVPIVAISANITPLLLGAETHAAEDEDEHSESGVDPHVWFDIANVQQWVTNTVQVFAALDPNNTVTYENNAAAYRTELDSLADYSDAQLAAIPADRRYLVTNHDAFGYFARAYDFTIIGTIIPAASTFTEPSVSDLATLIDQMNAFGVCTIFTETTVSDALARTAAAELDDCQEVRVLPLYTGSLGPPGSGADSYIGMYRTIVDTVREGLE